MSCTLTVAQGQIKGQELTAFDGTKYFSFEGIPFARPPVGELRFRDPQPPDSWTGVRDCTKPGNKCAQLNPLSNRGLEGSEDCLYLNVYTPSVSQEKLEKLPVIFFIHGGRLLVGYGHYYQPDYFIRHNVILVTTNYRLNILGFLCLDIPEVPGNAGLKDCAMALKWVKNNIVNFNGDSDNITVMGESAGAAIATNFLTSKMTFGLFNKLINQSGNHIADSFIIEQDNVKVASRVAKYLGQDLKDKRSLYEFFKTVSIEDLVVAYMTAEMEKQHYILNPTMMAVVEKEFDGVEAFIHESPIESMRHGRFMKVPTISGCNLYEGAAFVQKDDNGIVYERNLKYFIPKYLYLSEGSQKFERIVNGIRKFYFQNREIDDNTKIYYIRMVSEAFFHRDIVAFSELVSKRNEQYYSFHFQYMGNLNIGVMKALGVKGTTHGDMVQYQFYRKNKAHKIDKRDADMVNFLSECWTNFAKTGKPSWTNQKLEWVPYTPEQKLTLVVDSEIKLERNRYYDSFKFWTELCGERAKL